MRPRTRLSLLTFLILSVVAAHSQNATFTVNTPVLNMFHEATNDTDVVSQALFGHPVVVLETSGGWAKVRTVEDQYVGWVEAKNLIPGEYATSGRVGHVANLFANLYREPDLTKHQPLMTLPFEARLEVISESEQDGERWLRVQMPGRQLKAWVQRGDLTFEDQKLSIPDMIAFARSFMGLPYFWGGRSTFGYDCSGFMQMLERQRGYSMPRDASVQAKWEGGVTVERKDLQAGDLLYFGTPDKITHTGMYIGNGEFIHATTHDHPVIQISRIDDKPWTSLLVVARRVK